VMAKVADESDGGEQVVRCEVCEKDFLPEELEAHRRFSHGLRTDKVEEKERSLISTEALLRTLTPQPDYLLRCLTPLPIDTLDDLLQ